MSALAPFRCPPPSPPPTTVHRSDVGTAAWYALRRDGVVRPIALDVAVRSDLPESPELRAAALARVVPDRAVVGRRSAAWVHAGGTPPTRVELLFAPGGRRTDPDPGRVATEARLDRSEVIDLGAVRVTSVRRTGIDLARHLPPDEALPALRRLLAVGFDPRDAQLDVARLTGARGVRRARDTLAAVIAELDETPLRPARGRCAPDDCAEPP